MLALKCINFPINSVGTIESYVSSIIAIIYIIDIYQCNRNCSMHKGPLNVKHLLFFMQNVYPFELEKFKKRLGITV